MKKVIAITGASDGLGAAAARQLVAQGHQVIIIGRDPEKTERLAEALHMPWHTADFARLRDVAALAEVLKRYPRIDVLASNAGAVMNRRTETEDGCEKTFQVNVLAPFLLVHLLREKLLRDGTAVIATTSMAPNLFVRSFDASDLQSRRRYSAVKAYSESKLCDILLTRYWHRSGLKAVAFQPGIPRTHFAAEGVPFLRFMYHSPFRYLFTISSDRAAKRLVRLAAGEPEKDFRCGEIYSGRRRFRLLWRDDGTAEKRLIEACLTLTAGYADKEI